MDYKKKTQRYRLNKALIIKPVLKSMCKNTPGTLKLEMEQVLSLA